MEDNNVNGINRLILAKYMNFSPCINLNDIADNQQQKQKWRQKYKTYNKINVTTREKIEKLHKYAKKIVNLTTIVKLKHYMLQP